MNLTTCGGCDVPARLALTTQTNKKKKNRSAVLLERQTAKTTFANAEERVCRVYVCGGTVCFSAFFFSEKKVFHIRKTGRPSRKTVA